MFLERSCLLGSTHWLIDRWADSFSVLSGTHQAWLVQLTWEEWKERRQERANVRVPAHARGGNKGWGGTGPIPKATEMWSCQNTYFNVNKVSKEYAYKSVRMGRCLEQIPGFRLSGNSGDKWCETKVLPLFLLHLEAALLSPKKCLWNLST